ncbi:MAG TPA: PEGA domain-containing protein [Myxococcaceae bacterium]
MLNAAVSGLLVGLLAAGPALAQQPPLSLMPRVLPGAGGPKLAVVVVPLDAAAQSQVPRLLAQAEQAVANTGRFELVRLVDALDSQGARAREQKAQEAASAFQEGQKAYDELDTQKALERFDAAAKTYEDSDLTRHFADMSRARVMKIASYVANGDNKEAAQQMKDVLARNPRAEFSPNYFPPDQLALVEKTRKAVLAEEDKTLEVSTGKVSAQIFLDGQFEGTSPLKLSDLSRADHYVTAIAPGYALAQERVSGDKDKVELTLKPVPSAKRWQELIDRIADKPEGEERDKALRELGALTGTQQVLALLVRASPGAGARDAIALRLEVSDGHNAGYATGPVPSSGEAMDPAIRSLLGQVLETDAPRAGGPVTHFSATGPSPGRRTAGYVLMATGVALVAGGVYFGLEASSKADDFKKAPQNSPRAEQLRSDGKTFALIADVGILAGLASAGAGTWLAFLSGKGGAKKQSEPSRVPARAPEPTPQPEPTPALAPAVPAPAPQAKPPASSRADEKRAREEAAKAEAEERRKREEEARLKKEQEERRKREEEERRKREEEKKKRPALDEDDLRNY